jgi:enoyl-CoA hydratase/carnithine racemase
MTFSLRMKRPIDNNQSMSVRVERSGPVATVAIDRPQARNALDRPAMGALVDALRAQAAAPEVRVIVFTGTGEAFCAGDDLREAASLSPAEFRAHIEGFQEITRIVCGAAQPVIARIPGPAYGGGLEIAVSCDFRVAAAGASFGCPEVRWGLALSNASSRLLPELVGPSRARRMLLLGERLDAAEAERAGLVDEVVATEGLDAATDRVAAELLRAAPGALAATKRLLNDAPDRSLEEILTAEAQAGEDLFGAPAAAEGLRAFAERREPDHS